MREFPNRGNTVLFLIKDNIPNQNNNQLMIKTNSKPLLNIDTTYASNIEYLYRRGKMGEAADLGS